MAQAADPAPAFDFPSIDGGKYNTADWRGKPVLVVNTASMCGYTPQYTDLQAVSYTHLDVYKRQTKGMATDWAKHGLQCNAIAPGYFLTPLNKALIDDPAFNDWLIRRTPAGRWGNVEELVGACIFLSSAAASFVNGTTVYVDGGITISL